MASTEEKYSPQEEEMGTLGQVFLGGSQGLLRRGCLSSLLELKSVLGLSRKGMMHPEKTVKAKVPRLEPTWQQEGASREKVRVFGTRESRGSGLLHLASFSCTF